MDLPLPPEALCQETIVELPNLPFPHLASGKVREIYDLGSSLLLVATDRISAYDHSLQPGIPGKGIFLNEISRLWFRELRGLVNLQVSEDEEEQRRALDLPPALFWRSLLVKKCKPIPLECVVRGYLSGSGWKDYQRSGKVQGIDLPPGLQESEKLPQPIFTPTTKEKEDRPLAPHEAREFVGESTYNTLKDLSFKIFAQGSAKASKAGLILADTKFEFGLNGEKQITLIDEVLTPDSSRFWPADKYAPGRSQPSFDKQFVRDFMRQSGWQKGQPVPRLSDEVVQGTHHRYREAWERLRNT